MRILRTARTGLTGLTGEGARLLWYVICAAQKGRSRGPGRRISNAPTAGCYERLLRKNAIGMPYSRLSSEKDILQSSCDRGGRGGTQPGTQTARQEHAGEYDTPAPVQDSTGGQTRCR